MINNRDFFEKLNNVKCIAYDFDGVMTDNRVLVDENGKEAVFVNRSDGFAISHFKKMGILQVIVSTERNPVVAARAKKLEIDYYYGVDDKGSVLKEYCKSKGIELKRVLFIGNDLNDLSAFFVAGITGAPSDAYEDIKEKASWVFQKKGGDGVIRELYDYLNGGRI